jgi:type II secretory pathway pseudopilin PulG
LKNEKGLSVVELLITLGVLVVALAGAYSLLLFGNTSWQRTSEKMLNRQEAARALNRISADLRESTKLEDNLPLIELADHNEIVFYANTDSDDSLEKVHYYLANKTLMRGITQPDKDTPPWTYSGKENAYPLARYIESSEVEPLFEYLASTYPEEKITDLPANKEDRQRIRSVKIKLKVDFDPTREPEPVYLESEVFLRNAD